MYKDVKRAVKVGSYASISEMIRDSAEEDEILETAATPDDNDEVWETEEDITRGFEKLRKKIKSKSVKNKTKRYIQHPI